jgi:transposase
MLSLDSGRRYLLWRGAADMRRGMDSLCGLVRDAMSGDPISGDVYIFINKRRNQIKMLVWDRTGYVLYWKRLETGTFSLPDMPEGTTDYTITWQKLIMVLEGMDEKKIKQKKRYSYPQKVAG